MSVLLLMLLGNLGAMLRLSEQPAPTYRLLLKSPALLLISMLLLILLGIPVPTLRLFEQSDMYRFAVRLLTERDSSRSNSLQLWSPEKKNCPSPVSEDLRNQLTNIV